MSLASAINWAMLTINLSIGLVIHSAFACDPCGMHSSVQIPGVMNALRTTGLQSDAWTFGIQEQLSTFDVRGENDLRTTETDLELIRNLSVTQFSLAYNVSSKLAVQLNAPFVARNYDHFERYKKVRDTESGLGDSSVFATYSPYSYNDVESRFFMAGLLGIKAPTGDTGSLKRLASNDGESSDLRIQGRGLTLGTGSIDIPLGLVGYGRQGRALIFSTVQYTIRTEGAADYQFANDCSWSLAPGWLFLLGEEESLTLSGVLSGEHKGSDHLDNQLLPRTAMNNIYLGPELFYSMTNKVSVQLGIDLPIALDVGGAVVKPETRTRFAVSISY